jgi:hypothetical protein
LEERSAALMLFGEADDRDRATWSHVRRCAICALSPHVNFSITFFDSRTAGRPWANGVITLPACR